MKSKVVDVEGKLRLFDLQQQADNNNPMDRRVVVDNDFDPVNSVSFKSSTNDNLNNNINNNNIIINTTNSNNDDDADSQSSKHKQQPRQLQQQHSNKAEKCVGCMKPITERYLLKVMNQSWHEDCLKCSCCNCRLGEVGSTLFTRANLMLCKRDYLRLFGATGFCSACTKPIPAFEMVMRAKDNVYHLDCFSCYQCSHRFCVGDRYYLIDNKIFCEVDFEERFPFSRLTSANNPPLSLSSSSPSSSSSSSSSATSSSSFLTVTNSVASNISALKSKMAVHQSYQQPQHFSQLPQHQFQHTQQQFQLHQQQQQHYSQQQNSTTAPPRLEVVSQSNVNGRS